MIRRSLKMFRGFGLLCGTAVPTAPLFLTLVSVMLVLVLSSCEDSTVDPPRESQQVPDSTVYTDTTFFPDTIGPSVIQSFPYNEQEDVPPDINISVVFSEPIYAPSVTDTTFYLNPHVSGDLYVDSNIITLIPTPILVRNYDYELVIADSVTDSSGNNLPEGYRLSFLTESTRPTIDRFEPENGWFGVQVTVLGSGFGNSRDRATVRFGGTVAEIQGIEDSLITVLVPANAESGPLWVITNGKDSCESVGSFNVPEWEKHWAFNLDAYDIAWSDSVFVAVGVPGPWDLSIWYSHDLMNWRYDFSQSLLQHPYYSVIWADTVFVAVGRSGRVITSTDGIHWTERAVGATQYFNDVTWSGSLFVAVGRHIIMVSEDAINWRIVDSTLDNQTMSCGDIVGSCG